MIRFGNGCLLSLSPLGYTNRSDCYEILKRRRVADLSTVYPAKFDDDRVTHLFGTSRNTEFVGCLDPKYL